MQIHVLIDEKRHGPYSPDEVRQYLSTGQLQPQTLGWRDGMTDWQPLETFPEFAAPSAQAGRGAGRSRTRLYVWLAVGGLAACAVAGWLLWHGKQSGGSASPAGASPASGASSVAGAADSVAGHPDWPKTLAELNEWYVEPPAGQNAAVFFLQGFDVMSNHIRTYGENERKNGKLPIFGNAPVPSLGSPMPAATKTAIVAFMEQTKPAWDLFQQGSSLAQSRYPLDFTKGESLLLPHLAHVKQATQAAEIYALLYADNHRGKEAGESLLIGYAIGRSLEAEPLLLSQLVRMSCNAILLEALEQTVNRVAIPSQSLLQLQEVLGRMADLEASGESLNRAFVGEMVAGLHYFDMSPEQLQKTMASFGTNLPNDTDGVIAKLQKNVLKNAKADRQFFAATWDQEFAARKEPFPSRLKAGDFFAQRVSEAKTKQFLITTMFLPALGKTTLREGEALAQLRLAQTAAALERFRAAGGDHYPNDLAELSPKFLASVPEDPFNGQPLRYTKSGNGYALRSIGPPDASDAKLKSLTFTVTNPPKPAAAEP
jgi:hypothetical protein